VDVERASSVREQGREDLERMFCAREQGHDELAGKGEESSNPR
jgi:hypothetical protein